ncbi:MAG: F0F1 ATP synthase subunit B [Bacteroidota bacterium]|nr:F0F1 ATP synthase subunit B [Bacteroidota bacterium]
MNNAILLANPLINPKIGLMFWTLVTFIGLLIVLRKFAWKPILEGLKQRETSIQSALDEAKRAKEDMTLLKNENQILLQEARQERDIIMKEAKEIKEKILADAHNQAKDDVARMTAQARESIEKEKLSALRELKDKVVELSIEAAGKILQTELSSENKQKELVGKYINLEQNN